MSLFEEAKEKAQDLVDKVTDEHAAREEKAESDITPDPNVAGSRANTDDDGTYVGRTNPQYDAETMESGAEARSEAARKSDD
jgi:hypothetical protein